VPIRDEGAIQGDHLEGDRASAPSKRDKAIGSRGDVLRNAGYNRQSVARSASNRAPCHVMPVDAEVTRAIVRLSRDQNAAIKTEQLRAAGLTRHAIAARVKRGRLVPWFHGVYIVGDPELMPLAKPSAALLSLGPTATLSHRSAAALWGFAEPNPLSIDVTVRGNRRPRKGVRLHRVRTLNAEDVTVHKNLRITTPARTLIDFASRASSAEIADAFGEAGPSD
jgi:predicted transcriptional regulator of viral defense system